VLSGATDGAMTPSLIVASALISSLLTALRFAGVWRVGNVARNLARRMRSASTAGK